MQTPLRKLAVLIIALISFTALNAQWAFQCPPFVGTNSNGQFFEGENVAMSADGNTAVETIPINDGLYSGFFVYRWQGSQWVQQAFIKDIAVYGGISVAISSDGNTIAFADGLLNVYVYENSNWHLQQQLSATQGGALALSYDGNTLLCSNLVWVRAAGIWSIQYKLEPTDRPIPSSLTCDTAHHFSCSITVSLSADGNTAVISDIYMPDTTTNAWVFVRNGTTWSQQGSRLEGVGNTDDLWSNLTAAATISGDGNTIVIGNGQGTNSGNFWVFTRSANVWTEQGSGPYHTNSFDNGPPGVVNSLSYDGNNLITTAGIYHDFCYWQRTGATWTQIGTNTPITYSNYYETLSDDVGPTPTLSIDSSGTRMLIGDDQFRTTQGDAYFFNRTGTTWVQTGNNLTGAGASGGGGQGDVSVISRDGNYIAESGYNDNGAEGAVWIFKRNGPNWTQLMPKLFVPDSIWQPRYFGFSVSLSADASTLAVGAPYSNEFRQGPTLYKGNVYVYTLNGGTYTLQGDSLTSNTFNQFGYTVSLSDDGNTLLVGGDTSAYVYVRNGTVWSQQAQFTPGSSVWQVTLSGDGNTAVIGSQEYNNYKGSISIYSRTGTTWTPQVVNLYPSTVVQDDWFPTTMAISQNGSVLACGDLWYNGEYGNTFVYTRTGSAWSLTDSTTVNDGGYSFEQGMEVAISTSGDTIAVCGQPGQNGLLGISIYVRSGNKWPLVAELANPSSQFVGHSSFSASGDMSLLALGNTGYVQVDKHYSWTGDVGVLCKTNMMDAVALNQAATCLQSNNGKLRINMSGGVPPYQFTWSNGAPNTDSAVNLAPGSYTVTISDAGSNSFIRQYTVGAADSMGLSYTTGGFNCNTGTGYLTVAPQGGQPAYSYIWNTMPVQHTDTAFNIQPGNYDFTVTDNGGCTYSGTTQLTGSAYWSEITSTQPNCANNGSATATIYGGTEPYSYSWSGGGHSATDSSLGVGTYTVTLSDATGCSSTGSTTLNVACNGVISGLVFFDRNNNCLEDGADKGDPNLTVIATSGNTVAYGSTDSNGYYQILVPAAGTYVVSIGHWQNCSYNVCTGGTYPAQVTLVGAGDTISKVNFPLVYSGIDLAIDAQYQTPYPGFQFNFEMLYGNLEDSVVPNGVITLVYDGNLVYNSTNVPYATNDNTTHTITWNASSVMPFINGPQAISVAFNVPNSVVPRTKLMMDCSIAPTTGDCNVLNNNLLLVIPVGGSIDPNYKIAYPSDTLTSIDSVVTYTIHFQNIGASPTHYVEITDTLSADMDPSTVRTVATSYSPYTFTLKQNGILDWLFSPFELPSSAVDSVNSQAFVTYQVKLKPSRSTGTVITNTASVYFDYNNPIQTNTVQNIVNNTGVATGEEETIVLNNAVSVYPNPFSTYTTFQLTGDINQYGITLTDMLGQNVISFPHLAGRTFRFNRGNLPAGCYLFRVTYNNGGSAYGKLVVE